jgi:hypothetical protein
MYVLFGKGRGGGKRGKGVRAGLWQQLRKTSFLLRAPAVNGVSRAVTEENHDLLQLRASNNTVLMRRQSD